MSSNAKVPAQKLQLLTQSSRKGQTEQRFDVTTGDGDAGAPLRVKAQSATRYELRDPQSERAPEKVRAKRAGRDLEIFFEGSVKADIIIEQYYDEGIVESPKDSLTGRLPKGDLSAYVIDEGARPALTTLVSQVTPITLVENVVWFNPWWLGGGAGLLAAAGGGGGQSAPDVSLVPPGGNPPTPSVPPTGIPSVPTSPGAQLSPNSDTGASNTDKLTNVTRPLLEGTGTAGDTITVKNAAGQVVATTTVAANGTWQVTPAQPLVEGLNNLSITATSPAGAVSPAVPLPITIDTVAPATPATALAASSDTGVVGDSITADNTPTITGTGTPGDTIKLYAPDGTTLLGTAVVAAGGAWSITPAAAQPLGLNNFVVTATDAAGNTSAPATLAVTIVAGTPPDLVVQGSVAAGPVSGGADVMVYDSTGTLLGQSAIAANGTFRVVRAGMGDYRGTVLVKVIDANGLSTNYLDEVSASPKSLDTALRAMGVAEVGSAQFVVVPATSTLTIHITPITELAVRKAVGVSADVPPAASVVLATNAAVAQALGLAGVDITATAPTTTNSGSFDAAPLVQANGSVALTPDLKYGLALAKLSGVDSNTGSLASSLTQLAANIDVTNGTLNATGATLVDAGRQTALNALKAAPTAAEQTFSQDTQLNRWLLGEVLVTTQTPTGNSVAVTGTALPLSTVTVTLPNGTTVQAPVDATGRFSVSLPASVGTATLSFTGSDGLVQPAATPFALTPDTPPAPPAPVLPSAPVADMAAASDTGVSNTDNITRDNTPAITGTGTAGDTITVTMPGTGEVLTTTVTANGTWSVTPLQALADGTANASVVASNAAGTSPATLVAITLDTTPPAVPTVAALTSNTLTPPTLTGTAVLAAGETLTVNVHGATYAVTPNAQGVWSLDLTTASPVTGTLAALVDGQSYSVTATATDAAGNTSTDSTTSELVINTSAPSVTLPEAPNAVNAAEKASNAGTPLRIALPTNARDGDTLTSDITNPDGTVITLTTVLSAADITAGQVDQLIPTANLVVDGVWSTRSTITPSGGNPGPAGVGSFTLDTTAPHAPAADVAALSDTGASQTDNNTADNTPTISGGSATPGDTITVSMPGTNEVLTAVVAANGTWSVTPTQALPNGALNVSVTATDPAGNTSSASLVSVVIDATAPAAPSADMASASDSGSSQTDKITSITQPVIVGTGSAGETITVTFPTGEELTTTVANDGTWSVKPTLPLPEGLSNVLATATDLAGNTSVPATVPVTIDTTPPAAPAADVAATSDLGSSNTDNVTRDNTPTLSGNGTPGDTITVTYPTGEVLTAVVASNGTWSVEPTQALGDGVFNVSVTATDPAGNTSAPANVPVTIDTTANVPTVVPTLGNTLTPVITGGANLAPGESMTVNVGGATYAVVPDASGAWALNLATATPTSGSLSLVTGTSYDVTAVITDAAGNVGTDVSAGELDIDTGRIAVSLPEEPLGVNAAEAASAGGTPLVCGLPVGAVAGDVVTTVFTRPGAAGTFTIATTLSAADVLVGRISQLIPSSELIPSNNGAWTTSTKLNNGTATPGGFTLDTVAPAAPAADVAALSDTGSSNSDNNTADNTPTISGTGATPGDTITVTLPTGEVLKVVVAAGGNWSVTPTLPLPDGLVNALVTATDPAGNTSLPTTLALVIDTTAPAAPGVAIPEAAGGVSAAEAGNGVQLTVTLPPDARVGDVVTTVVTAPNGSTSTLTYTVQAADVPSAQGGTASGTGPFTVAQTVPLLTLQPAGVNTAYLDGAWTTLSTLTDPAGNISPAMADGFTLAATPPTISIATVAGDNTVNAAEASGALPVAGSTTAEPGQTVTVQLVNGGTVLGTYTAVVQANGRYSLNIPAADVPADGAYILKADVANVAGTPAAQASQALLVDKTAPVITITSIAGDTIDATHLTGEFDAAERGALTATAVSTRPVISGTTDAEVGQTVTLTLDSKTYTTTVQSGGVWTYTLSNADALSLGHGSSYAITASVSDVAGNTGSDTDNSLVVNIAAPDTPTVVEQFTALHTPIVTGRAQKDPGNSTFIDLATGDVLTVTVNSVTYSLTVGGTSSPAGLTYANGTWSLLPASIPNGHYEVAVSVTAGGVTKTDISSTELHINDVPPVITLNPISGGTLNDAESAQALPITGTTDAPVGATVTLLLNGQSYTALVQAGGTFSVTVPGTAVAAIADGSPTLSASVVNAYGLTGNGAQTFLVDTTTPGAATVVIPEGTLVNAAEALSAGGTPLNITLPAGSQVGDVVNTRVTAPDGSVQVLTTTLTAAQVTAGSISQVVPTSALNVDGAWTTATTITDTAGNTGPSVAGGFTLDTTAPAAPSAILNSASDSGLAGDSTTNDSTPTLSGAGEPGDTITVKDAAGNVIASATVQPDGTWSATPAAALPEGLNALQVTATDLAGNTSAPSDLPVTIDTMANVPTVVPTLGNTLTPTLNGGANLAPGETLTVNVGGATYAVVPNAQGVWTLNLATATPTSGALVLANGTTYPATAVITDAAGNVGTDTSTGELSIDVGRIAVSLPEATNGVNALEAASAGGTPVVSLLPSGAVAGDIVTTTVTKPGSGGTITLSTTLSAADIVAGSISQLISSSELTDAHNGAWTTSTQLNNGPATPGGFILDTVAPAAPAADVAATSDTGASNTDNNTSDNTPVISGADATPGDTITVTLPTGEVLKVVVPASGNWSVTPTQALPDGAANVLVTATDPAGNTSLPTTVALTIDTAAPAAPTVIPSSTSDTTPVISGSAVLAAGDTLTVTVNGATYTVVPDALGQWRLDTGTATPANGALAPFVNGQSYSVTATTTDAAGNASADSSTAELSIDTSLPPTPAAPNMTASTDSGNTTDNITNDSTPAFQVSPPPAGGSLVLYVNGVPVPATYNAADGTLTPNSALPDGLNSITYAAQVGSALSGISPPLTIVVDTVAPVTPPAPDLTVATDSGASNTDNITNDTTPYFTVAAPPAGGTVVLWVDGAAIAATYDPITNTITPNAPLAEGVHTIAYKLVDVAGNASAASTALSVTIDSVVPATPAAPDMTPGTDTGVNTDNLTGNSVPSFAVDALPANGKLQLLVDGVLTPATYNAGTGTLTPLSPLPDGPHTIT